MQEWSISPGIIEDSTGSEIEKLFLTVKTRIQEHVD